MASQQLQSFHIFNMTTGAPITGAVIGPGGLEFEYYKNELGADLAKPVIFEQGGGAYAFEPAFITDHCINYVITVPAGTSPTRIYGFIRPEDYVSETIDTNVGTLLDHAEGKWTIFDSGPDANRMVVYDRAGSVLKKFDLFDASGNPTAINPYSREPV
jgi:hypothetical protein